VLQIKNKIKVQQGKAHSRLQLHKCHACIAQARGRMLNGEKLSQIVEISL
jgi:hypothetical protein